MAIRTKYSSGFERIVEEIETMDAEELAEAQNFANLIGRKCREQLLRLAQKSKGSVPDQSFMLGER